jgi:site-specific recombinase XerD
MKPTPRFAALLERFFTQRLMAQRQVSPNTIASYRDTFHLLLQFAQKRLRRPPSALALSDLDAPLISAFLDDLEQSRGVIVRTRNLRLTAIRSFFRYAAYQEPANSGQIQQVLSIPSKRHDRRLVGFLTRVEIEALLAAPNIQTWDGRRDRAFLMMAIQTGLRLSEMTGLRRRDIELGRGPHVRCLGKGRKERCTPFTPQTVDLLKAWLKEPVRGDCDLLFPTIHGGHMSADAVQYLVAKHATAARMQCPTLKDKRVTPHVMRHTAAMELLQSGVESTVIALWLGHESIKTTQIYLDADLALKEAALARMTPIDVIPGRFRPADALLQFLKNL